MVIPARDPDIGVLAALRSAWPELSGRMLVGPPEAATIFNDKWRTYTFARQPRAAHC